MNNMAHTKFKMKDQIIFNDGLLRMPISEASCRLVGKVTIDEYDAYGRLVFSSTETNDLTMPGSIFILEQMFKTNADNKFLHPRENFPIEYGNDSKISLSGSWSGTPDTNNEKIIGFMVGNKGDTGASVVSPDYKSTFINSGDNSSVSFMPFVISNSDTENGYTLKVSGNNKNYYYVKLLDEGTKIYSKWADGSGDVNPGDIYTYNTPILTFAECHLSIEKNDLRDYFGEANLDTCSVSQLGLVAGYYNSETNEYDNIKLVTLVNFKARDLSNSDNTLKVTYRIYCM